MGVWRESSGRPRARAAPTPSAPFTCALGPARTGTRVEKATYSRQGVVTRWCAPAGRAAACPPTRASVTDTADRSAAAAPARLLLPWRSICFDQGHKPFRRATEAFERPVAEKFRFKRKNAPPRPTAASFRATSRAYSNLMHPHTFMRSHQPHIAARERSGCVGFAGVCGDSLRSTHREGTLAPPIIQTSIAEPDLYVQASKPGTCDQPGIQSCASARSNHGRGQGCPAEGFCARQGLHHRW